MFFVIKDINKNKIRFFIHMKIDFDLFTQAYRRIIMENADGKIRKGYDGPWAVSCAISDPIDLAAIEEINYERFLPALKKFVKSLELLKADVSSDEDGGEIRVGFIADNKEDLTEFLKLKTVTALAGCDESIGSMIYDLTDGTLFPDDLDSDLDAVVDACYSMHLTEVSVHDSYDNIRDGSSNAAEYFLSEEYLKRAETQLTFDEA